MSLQAHEIREAFDELRTFCDPRGFDLLDVLEEALVAHADAADRLDNHLLLRDGLAVVRGEKSLPRVQPVDLPNDDHSKVAHLRRRSIAT